MESPLSDYFRMHWDHEPRQLVGRGVLTAPRLGGLGTARPTLWFMERESLLGLDAAHSGHERNRPPARPRPRNQLIGSRTRTRTKGRFMESPHDFCGVHWDHEPVSSPLSR